MENKPTIEVTNNGPYKLTGVETLASQKGNVESKPQAFLCRCGDSANKPFCDGTHAKVGFTGDKVDDRTPDKKDTYTANNITVTDNRGACAHAGFCTDGLPKAFRHKGRPFVDASGATPEEIASIVKKCPSGAIRFEMSGDSDTPENTGVFIAPNGPYVLSNIELKNESLNDGANPNRITLCRCGKSKNKPFCNGAHWNHKFDV